MPKKLTEELKTRSVIGLFRWRSKLECLKREVKVKERENSESQIDGDPLHIAIHLQNQTPI